MKSAHRSSVASASSPHMPPHHPMAGPSHHPPLMPYPPPMGAPYPPPYMMPGLPPYPMAGPHPPMPPLTLKGTTTTTAANTKNGKGKGGAAAKQGDAGEDGAAQGLELLASLAFPVPAGAKGKANGNAAAKASSTAAAAADGATEAESSTEGASKTKESITAAAAAGSRKQKRKSRLEDMGPKDKLFVEKVRECDVLCGRGGKSNHHPGNKRYRQVVSEMKRTYQSTGAKTAKTDLSRAIVEHVVGYGGRFIKRDESTGQYFLLTKAQARRKTSQALRETKELKWTM